MKSILKNWQQPNLRVVCSETCTVLIGKLTHPFFPYTLCLICTVPELFTWEESYCNFASSHFMHHHYDVHVLVFVVNAILYATYTVKYRHQNTTSDNIKPCFATHHLTIKASTRLLYLVCQPRSHWYFPVTLLATASGATLREYLRQQLFCFLNYFSLEGKNELAKTIPDGPNDVFIVWLSLHFETGKL